MIRKVTIKPDSMITTMRNAASKLHIQVFVDNFVARKFSALAFAGSVFFYRAFIIAFPETRPNLYRLLIFFLPSILFWPSSLGKDAWVFFGSGFVAYGLTSTVRSRLFSGLLTATLGLLLISVARPHIALAMVFSAVVAFALQGIFSCYVAESAFEGVIESGDFIPLSQVPVNVEALDRCYVVRQPGAGADEERQAGIEQGRCDAGCVTMRGAVNLFHGMPVSCSVP